jgi:acetyl-CoA carboxylase biotin carboxyl carrier protein
MAARKEQSESSAKASVNMEELRELIALLRDNGLAELELEREDFRVRLRREGAAPSGDHSQQYVPHSSPAPVSQPDMGAATATPSTPAPAATNQGAQAGSAPAADQDLHMITSPIVGTFYRSPSPTAEPFVKIGSNVEASSVVCIIEAMKLMNEIQAEASGEVVKIYVENGQPVEYGQPLFGIRS